MDAGTRQKRVEGLEAIKGKALNMAKEGKTDGEIRDFIDEGKRELAFNLPDEDAFRKAVKAAEKYKKSKK
tara:strand:- start:936 stop:1145 length:210 start_codon:yes stop_codon:yes gene_type:complete